MPTLLIADDHPLFRAALRGAAAEVAADVATCEADIQERTVKAHLSAIFEKLGARNRTQAGVILRELEIGNPSRRAAD